MLGHDKEGLYYAILYPIMFICIAVGVGAPMLSPDTESFNAVQNTVVTASAYDAAGKTVFVDENSGFSLTQDFSKCRLNRASTIGLIKDASFGEEAGEALERIFDEINLAYYNID